MSNAITTANDFLPAAYEVPNKNDKYMKWEQGENRFRIMSSPILGFEWWTDGEDGTRKVHRVPMGLNIPTNEVEDPSSIRHFWAMIVWNYRAGAIQILEVTQKLIQQSLRAYAKDEDWGSPVNKYDIVVTRSGTTKEDTKYEVMPKPAKPTDEKILEEMKNTPIRLEALYEGADPFMQVATVVNEDVDPEEVETGIEKARIAAAKIKGVK